MTSLRSRFAVRVTAALLPVAALAAVGGCSSDPRRAPAAPSSVPHLLAVPVAAPAPWHRPWHVVPPPPKPAPVAAPGGGAGAPPGPVVRVSGGVTALGDSVMLGAAYALQSRIAGINVDAVESRSFYAGEAEVQQLRASGRLAPFAVIHLGTNGPFGAADFDAMMQALSSCRRVVWLTVHEPRSWQDEANATIRAGAARWARRGAVLVDWYAVGNAHPEYFYSDGIHLMPAGAAGYAAAVAAAL